MFKPVVSVNVEPVTGVGVVPLPVVETNEVGVTIVADAALTAAPPRVKPTTLPVVANFAETVPFENDNNDPFAS